MKTIRAQRCLLALALGAGAFASGSRARASNPFEYPDNGAAAFSRGGAWLATGNEPIAAHYNPAALATQGSGFSVEQQLNYNKICFDRRDLGNKLTGPLQENKDLVYQEACTGRGSFPFALPSISLAFRASKKLGIGFAIVPPAAYGVADNAFSLTSPGIDLKTGKVRDVPSSYRYMMTNQQSIIVFPTVGVGYELFKDFRVGAAFIAGIASISTTVSGIARSATDPSATGDHAGEDTSSVIKTKDLFVPGVIASIHWSVTPQFDVSIWGRWLDSARASDGSLNASTQVYDPKGNVNRICAPTPDGTIDPTCSARFPNQFDHAVKGFVFPLPPEVRLGVRFHQPRALGPDEAGALVAAAGTRRDPLHDDVFDVEVDGSYTRNSAANTIEVRLDDTLLTRPDNINLPPNADRWNGFIDSYGVRLGGQWNAFRDKLGLRAGGWFESRSQEPEYLNVFPMGPRRWGIGGGIVFRQDFIDISFGYQHHWSSPLDNGGDGRLPATYIQGSPRGQDSPDTSAKDRRDYRTSYGINGGRLTQSANAFTLGATLRF